jgi:hypothetical protein
LTFVELQMIKARVLRIEADLREVVAVLTPHTEGATGPLSRENHNRLADARIMRERISAAILCLRPEPGAES